MIASRHSRLRETVMMDWLRELADCGVGTLPSPHDIMTRFDFDDTEAARTLIAQLADSGIIRVRRFSGGATFEILPPKPPRCAVSTVNRMVEAEADDEAHVDDLPLSRRESRQVDAAFAKIKQAMAAPAKKPMQAVPRITPAPPLPKVETVSAKPETPDAGKPIPAEQDHGPTAVTSPARSNAAAAEIENEPVIPRSQSVEARPLTCGHAETPDNIVPNAFGVERCRTCKNAAQKARREARKAKAPPRVHRFIPTLASVSQGKRRQVNMHVDPATYERVQAAAKTKGMPVSTWALACIVAALDAPEPMPKPHIDRDMMRAWKADGRPFAQFFRDMVMLGIETSAAFRVAAE